MKSFAAAFVLMLALTTGCSLFHHKKQQAASPDMEPAASVETEFRNRWITQRVHQLLTSGAAKSEAEAQQQAATEFAQRYPFAVPPPAKTKP